MKKIICLILSFALCLCFPAFARQDVTSAPGQGNKVIRIDGSVDTKFGGQNVNILMVKKDVTLNDNDISKIAHIGFTTVDARGNYSYKFTTDCNLSDYKVLTKVGNSDIISSEISITEESRLNIELNLSNKDKTAFSLSDTSQYELKAFVDNKLGSGKNVDLISAFYEESGRLIKAEIKNNFKIPFDWDGANSVGTVFESIPENTASIRLMVWENDNMKPLGNVSEYNSEKTDTKEFYVSPNGSDLNDGTFERPLKTLNGAKNAIREYREAKGLPQNGITVYFRGGTYPVTETVNFTEEDSGTKESPIVYKAWADEKVVFSGGLEISGADFSQAADERISETAKNNVYSVDLKKYGITDFGGRHVFNWTDTDPVPGIEAFYDDEPLVTARYPNVGADGRQQYLYMGAVGNEANIVTTNKATVNFSDGNGEHTIKATSVGGASTTNSLPNFVCNEDIIKNVTDFTDVVIEGWFPTGYEYSGCKIKEVNKETNTVYLAETTYYGMREYNRYCISNLLEALDTNGEYYIDKQTGKLYVYSDNISSATITLSLFGDTRTQTAIKMTNASNIKFEDLDIKNCRTTGITVLGGENVVIDGCTFKNMGLKGVIIGSDGTDNSHYSVSGLNANNTSSFYNKDFTRGFNHGIIDCDFVNTGKGAVSVMGGDRNNLVPSNHYLKNCTFDSCDRYQKSSPFASIYGVGITVAGNTFQNGALAAIVFGGNDIIIEKNKFSNMANDCVDYGIIYSCAYGAQINAGSEVRYNYFCNTPNAKWDDEGFSKEYWTFYGGQHEDTVMRVGVYNDNCQPFLEVHHNYFENIPIGMFSGSGYENNWNNNVFKNVNKPMSIQFNNLITDKDHLFDNIATNEYEAFNVASGAWATKYQKVKAAKDKLIARANEDIKYAKYPDSTITNNTCVFTTEDAKANLNWLNTVPQEGSDGKPVIKNRGGNGLIYSYGYFDKITSVNYFYAKDINKYCTITNNNYTIEDVAQTALTANGITPDAYGAKR